MKWFVVNGVTLFPVPFISEAKGLSGDDYSSCFATKKQRSDLSVRIKSGSLGKPDWVKVLAFMPETEQAYQVKGYEIDGAYGFYVKGK